MAKEENDPGVILENRALRLTWKGGALHALNRLSGRVWSLDFPAFALRLRGEELTPDAFAPDGLEVEGRQAAFSFRHRQSPLEVVVTYRLDGDKPWFRKRLILKGSPGDPTPDRLWVDLQGNPPSPVRRVGIGLRGGPEAEEQRGLETCANQPGCGYPVYAGDWFVGLEHPAAFAVPGERLELFHHPVWDDDGVIESFPAVFGVARSHAHVPGAFMDYLWNIRLPRLARPFVTISVGWSTPILGGGEYVDSFEANEAFLRAMLELGLRPDGLALDAGYFDRRSLFRHKGDDDQDTRFIAFCRACKERGLDLSLWVSHNGRTGFDMDWIRAQGWVTGEGPGTYSDGEYVVMMQRDFEEALARRFEELVGKIGARHLKIDWDNECATTGEFAGRYPTPDHVREASIEAFHRIDRRMRARNPALITRDGWWPSPWWLCRANHVWLITSGDCEYAAWPSRTQRDREMTHRDAVYHHIVCRSETPFPLDAFDNHGFAHALQNCFADEPHTWVDNAVLAVTRGTTYMHLTLCPEGLRQWQADSLQQVLDWMHYHADELGVRGTTMVGGNPAAGEIYGFLHPNDAAAWLVLRNPSPEPQIAELPFTRWLRFAPRTIRQVYPFWQDLPLLAGITLLGHEVRLLRLMRDPAPDPSPIPGAPFMVRTCDDGIEYLFPGNRRLSAEIGPSVHPDMQIPELAAERTADEAIEGGWRLQWYVRVPHRFEKAELYLRLRGSQQILDAVQVRAGSSRYRGVGARHVFATERIHRNETRGRGTSLFMPPLGPRERDDYVFRVPDSGWVSLTLDILGEGSESLKVDAWLTGYEAFARRTVKSHTPPADGPLLPVHPYGFSRCLRL